MAGNDPGSFQDSNDRDLQTNLGTSPVQQPSFQPVAKDTPLRFSPPALAQDNNLANLARSLQGFSADLDSFTAGREAKQNQVDSEQAQLDFAKSHGTGYADAVAAGTIPASASPAYVGAYKQAQGQLYGQNLEQRFQAAYDNWGGKDNLDDPNAFSKFYQDWASRQLAPITDPAVAKGLLPVLHEIAANGLKQNIEHQHQTVVQGYSDAQSAVVNNSIAGAVAYANSSGNPVDPNYIAKAVGDTYTQARGLGVKDEVAQRNAIIQITTAALLNKAHHGDEILKALDVPLPGSSLVLSQTPFGAEQKLKVTNDLESFQHTQVIRETAVQKATEKAALGTVESRVLDGLAKDPTKPVSEEDIKQAETMGGDPTFRNRALEWQERFQKASEKSDPTAIMNLTRDIMGGAGMAAVNHAVDTGVIRTPTDLKNMQEQVKEHAAADPIMKDVATSEAYKAVMGSIKSQTAATGAADPFGQVGLTPAGLGVQYELNKRMQTWAAANPGASYNDAQEQLAKTSADVLKLITLPKDSMFGGKATLPAGNPYAPPAAAPPAPTPGAPAPSSPSPTSSTSSSPLASASTLSSSSPSPSSSPSAPSPSTTGSTPAMGSPDPAKVQAWINGLSPPEQEGLARAALKYGKTPQALAAAGYQKATTQSPAGPLPASGTAAPASSSPFGSLAGQTAKVEYQPGAAQQFGDAVAKWRATDPNAEQTIHQLTGVLQGLHASLPYSGSTTMAAIKDNPQAAHILDFVAGPESGGNYNAYYGHAGSTKDLSGMTLDQIAQFQHDLVHVDHLPSSATGRYQFMPKTLFGGIDPETGQFAPGLKQQMGLTGSERFTPELQDTLALQLLKNRGLEQWQKGTLSDQGFMNNLAHEWASLPNVSTGRSQYDKDGLNKSLVTVPQVGKMIEEARGLKAGDAPTEGHFQGGGGIVPQTDATPWKPPAAATNNNNSLHGPNGIYANIPPKDEKTGADQLSRFNQWNPDPIGNQDKNLAAVHPDLAAVVKQAQADNPNLHFVVGNGVRTAEQQDTAKAWGWSKVGAPKGTLADFANKSGGATSHMNGTAVDLWGLDPNGKVQFEPGQQQQIAQAMKAAATKLGVSMNWGGDWKSFQDKPHFELAGAIKPWAGVKNRDSAVSTTSTMPPNSTNSSKPMTIGDSIGDGVKASIGGDGDTRVGRPPAEVLQRITALPDNALAGRPLILSSGMSNNPSENIATVGKQIDAAIAKGAKPGDIKLLGVGDRADFKSNSINQKLIALAAERGVSFVPLGQLPPGEHVHPNTKGYADIAARAMKSATATDGMEEATAEE